MKQTILLLAVLLSVKAMGQTNCNIFPKCKKENKPFFNASYTTFGAQVFNAAKSPKSNVLENVLWSANAGLTLHLKRHWAVTTSVATIFSDSYKDESFGIGYHLDVDYFFKKPYKGFGVGLAMNGFNIGSPIPTCNLIYANGKDKKHLINYYIGGGYNQVFYYFNLGIKMGVMILG